MGIRAQLRRWLNRDRPADHHTAFIRACLPDNPEGARDLERWLAFVGGPEALAVAENPFRSNLPALAYAIDKRGDKPPRRLRAVLGFTQLIEPRRAVHYRAIIEQLTLRMTASGLSGYLGGDAAAAQRAYPTIEARHITAVEIISTARQLPQLQALCEAEGFIHRQELPSCLELRNENGARLLLTSHIIAGDHDRLAIDLLADHPGGLDLLPTPLLFVGRCIRGYPPVNAERAPAMIDAALLAPLLMEEDWASVARVMSYARRDRLVTALRYLRDGLGIAVPLKRL